MNENDWSFKIEMYKSNINCWSRFKMQNRRMQKEKQQEYKTNKNEAEEDETKRISDVAIPCWHFEAKCAETANGQKQLLLTLWSVAVFVIVAHSVGSSKSTLAFTHTHTWIAHRVASVRLVCVRVRRQVWIFQSTFASFVACRQIDKYFVWTKHVSLCNVYVCLWERAFTFACVSVNVWMHR